jgi:2-polyprenyl-3-methyl-5-hydroxy-6-metoxy-1,4-benzoquinol methylase
MTDKPTQPEDVRQHYTAEYFEKWNYSDRPLGKYSMYWFARRYYAALVRRYAPPGGKLLELGSGLGDMLSLLQDDFECVGIDLIEDAVERSKQIAPRAQVHVMSADDLSAFERGAFSAVVALHLVEHLPDPADVIRQVSELLKPGGIFLFATPHPEYALRRFKDRDNDAIGKDKTHINVQLPSQWRAWCAANGMEMLAHFGDGLWDVPYLPVIPKSLQFAAFGFPAFVQVVTQTTFMPLALGVNQVGIARKKV